LKWGEDLEGEVCVRITTVAEGLMVHKKGRRQEELGLRPKGQQFQVA